MFLQGADFIPLVRVPNLVQELQGCMEGTVCTTIFTAFQTSEQAAVPRKHITQSLFFPSCSDSQCPKEQLFVYDNKAEAMATHCDVMGV